MQTQDNKALAEEERNHDKDSPNQLWRVQDEGYANIIRDSILVIEKSQYFVTPSWEFLSNQGKICLSGIYHDTMVMLYSIMR